MKLQSATRIFSFFHERPNERVGVAFVWDYLKRKFWLIALLTVTGLLAAIFEGGTVGVLGLAVSVLVGEHGVEESTLFRKLHEVFGISFSTLDQSDLFILLIGAAVLSQVIKNLLLYISEAAQLFLSFGLRRALQGEMVTCIMRMPLARVAKYPVGKLATIVDQGDLVAQIMGQIGLVIRATFMSIAYVSVMVWMSPSIALGTVIAIFVIWLFLSLVTKKLRKLADQAFKKRMDVWKWTFEFLSAPRLIRIFNAAAYAENLIGKARDQEMIPDRNTDLIQAIVPKALEVVTVTCAGLFLIGGFFWAGDSAIQVVPTFFVYVLIFFRIRPLVKTFNDFRMKVTHILPRLSAVGDVLRAKPSITSLTGKRPFVELMTGVEFVNVSFQYSPEDDPVLKGINLSMPRGQTAALVGPSGGGKSTLADLFLGLYAPSNGAIKVDGVDLQGLSKESWRRNIGVVEQDVFLVNASVRDNILFAREGLSDDDVIEAAKAANAHEFIVALRDGYDTTIGDRGFRLSGGQRQRLGLARALVHKPNILVLDEATSALDSQSEQLIQVSLESMQSEKTILIIAHRLSTIKNADQIVVIENGCITEKGDRESLLQNRAYFAEAWRAQRNTEMGGSTSSNPRTL